MTSTPETETRRVLVSKDGPIGWLLIDNPKRLNAMSFAMWGQLQSGVAALEDDSEVRVIVVAGNGDRAFCAGGDISEFGSLRTGTEGKGKYDDAGAAAMKALREADKPTIALIAGYCLGGGLGLALQCDLRLATKTAKLGLPAARRAIAYEFQGVKQLVDLIGPANTKDILYTARQLDGQEAYTVGLVNKVVPDDAIASVVRALALSISENAPLSIRASKMMVDMATADPAQRDIARCLAAEAACLESEDYAEATRAFMEKRPSRFTGR